MPEATYEELRTQISTASHIRAFVVVDEVKNLLAERDLLVGRLRDAETRARIESSQVPARPQTGMVGGDPGPARVNGDFARCVARIEGLECPQDAEDRELAEAINDERARDFARRESPEDKEPVEMNRSPRGPDSEEDEYLYALDRVGAPVGQSHGPRGERRVFETGAVRSTDADGFRYDLITPIGLRAVAAAYAEGSIKYGDFNWEKGMAAHDLLNHSLKHIYDFLAGSDDPTGLGHAAWGVMAAIHSLEMWPHLNEGHIRRKGCLPPAV